MLKSTRRILGQLLLLVGLLAGSTMPAQASGPTGGIKQCANLLVCVVIENPGSGGSPGSTGGSGGGSGGTQQCTWNNMQFDCWSADLGYFDTSSGCYLSAMDPQPDKGDPAWEGHNDGAVYNRVCHDPAGNTTAPGPIWLGKAPDAGAAPPDPGLVAQRAIAQLRFITPVPHTAPAGTALVGVPVWFWYDSASDKDNHDVHEKTVGPQVRSATLGSITVTATATLKDVVWDLGYKDKTTGQEVTLSCAGKNEGAGLPYQPGLEAAPPAGACTREFAKATRGTAADGGTVPYDLTVTEYWSIATVDGDGHQVWDPLELPVPSQPIELRVSELQVLN